MRIVRSRILLMMLDQDHVLLVMMDQERVLLVMMALHIIEYVVEVQVLVKVRSGCLFADVRVIRSQPQPQPQHLRERYLSHDRLEVLIERASK
jgi:hypothetical protein